MKTFTRISLITLLAIMVIFGCDKKDTAFRDYLGGKEVVYAGLPSNVNYTPGYLRTQLYWNPSPDQTITKYIIYWNNKADSAFVNANTHKPSDTMRVMISNLKEYSYAFTIYSIDGQGNRSIPLEINNVKVYGPLYKAGLLNRPYNADNPSKVNDDGTVTLNFNKADTINIATVIEYTNTSNVVTKKNIDSSQYSLTLSDLKPGTSVKYYSSYIPSVGALDTVFTNESSTFPEIKKYVECDKSLWAELQMPNDAQTLGTAYGPETRLNRIWDGDWSNDGREFWWSHIFHSNNAHLPAQLSFDLGKDYNELGRIAEMGRNCCATATAFEVWGISTNDINAAATSKPSTDAGWADEMRSKGWALLKDVVRTDNGQAIATFDLMKNPPPVRYIRLRIKAVGDGSNGDFQIAEVGFWNMVQF
ncbi:DUF4998 domain-containing protein [Chitinophagaceae bacterium 26-R-25]|nr:DUF4998 domain-containing protein [Chitinophagaceae bacterium 26-R-25]